MSIWSGACMMSEDKWPRTTFCMPPYGQIRRDLHLQLSWESLSPPDFYGLSLVPWDKSRYRHGSDLQPLRNLLPTQEEGLIQVIQKLLALVECLLHTVCPGVPLTLAFLPYPHEFH